jgi:hypothetical protein
VNNQNKGGDMKRFARVVMVLCAIVWMAEPAPAQTTISIVQAESMLNRGFTHTPDSVTTRLSVGSAGSNTLWDFSNLKSNIPIVLKPVAVNSTPYGFTRVGATHAHTGQASITYSGIPISATAWRYYTYTKSPGGATATLGTLGDMAAGTIPFLGSGMAEWVNSRPDTMYALPVSYLSTWKSSYIDTTFIQLNGSYLAPGLVTKIHNVTYTVDAYGAMKMPGGIIEQALRIKRVDTMSTGIVEVRYIFVSDRFARVEVTAKDAGQAGDTIDVTPPTWWNVAIPTDVKIVESTPVEYRLSQNYPNPFNPTTTIRFGLPERSTVTIKVFNLLGEEVATLVDGIYDAGERAVEFDAANLASGVYVYRLQAGTFTQTRKMVVMR